MPIIPNRLFTKNAHNSLNIKTFSMIILKSTYSALQKFFLINFPLLVVYFSSDSHKLPEDQEKKILITASKGGLAIHTIHSLGMEVTKTFIHEDVCKIIDPIIRIGGSVVQAIITNKTITSGLVRGGGYELAGSNLNAYALVEESYVLTDLFTKSNGTYIEKFNSASKMISKGFEVGILLRSVIKVIYIPIKTFQIPDTSELILASKLIYDFSISKALNVSNIIIFGTFNDLFLVKSFTNEDSYEDIVEKVEDNNFVCLPRKDFFYISDAELGES